MVIENLRKSQKFFPLEISSLAVLVQAVLVQAVHAQAIILTSINYIT